MFRFEFWDCGESSLKKFDHMLPVSGGHGWGCCLIRVSAARLSKECRECKVPVRKPRVQL